MFHVTNQTLEPSNTILQVVLLHLLRNSHSRRCSPSSLRINIPPGCVATAAVALAVDGDAGHAGLDAGCAVGDGFVAPHLALAAELATQPRDACVAASLAPGSGVGFRGLRHRLASKGSQG